jgi:hypothetical protein
MILNCAHTIVTTVNRRGEKRERKERRREEERGGEGERGGERRREEERGGERGERRGERREERIDLYPSPQYPCQFCFFADSCVPLAFKLLQASKIIFLF